MDTIKLPSPAIVVPVAVPGVTTTDTKAVASPVTTAEQDRMTSGQRHINVTWEYTQASIALMFTMALIYCEVKQIESKSLSNAIIMILAMYFQRTNHTKTGGVGGTDSR